MSVVRLKNFLFRKKKDKKIEFFVYILAAVFCTADPSYIAIDNEIPATNKNLQILQRVVGCEIISNVGEIPPCSQQLHAAVQNQSTGTSSNVLWYLLVHFSSNSERGADGTQSCGNMVTSFRCAAK